MPATDRPPALFRRLLGEAYEALPPLIRAVHDRPASWQGRCTVERGRGRAARLIARLMALPPAGSHERIVVTIESRGEGEVWTRSIGGRRMRSRLRADGGFLAESMGPATFRFALECEGARIRWRLRSVRLLGIPVPSRAFAIEACESIEADQYRFEVRAAVALVGRLVAYDGVLAARRP